MWWQEARSDQHYCKTVGQDTTALKLPVVCISLVTQPNTRLIWFARLPAINIGVVSYVTSLAIFNYLMFVFSSSFLSCLIKIHSSSHHQTALIFEPNNFPMVDSLGVLLLSTPLLSLFFTCILPSGWRLQSVL